VGNSALLCYFHSLHNSFFISSSNHESFYIYWNDPSSLCLRWPCFLDWQELSKIIIPCAFTEAFIHVDIDIHSYVTARTPRWHVSGWCKRLTRE
jgi:hypothetical protein